MRICVWLLWVTHAKPRSRKEVLNKLYHGVDFGISVVYYTLVPMLSIPFSEIIREIDGERSA